MAAIACPPGFELSPSHRDLAGDRDGVAVRRHRPPRDRSTQPRGFVADRNRGRQPAGLSDERPLPFLPESDLLGHSHRADWVHVTAADPALAYPSGRWFHRDATAGGDGGGVPLPHVVCSPFRLLSVGT